ncbi:Hint domain-containing protein [Pseudooceanicola sp. C21-150M6]|uniref:Hint domain-containing protein n=1 Tax=Pseudooceanicola sp. C21-150M6 TaxID=3434355 RepID=UPI003D7FDDAA
MTKAFDKAAQIARRMSDASGAYNGAGTGANTGLMEGTKVMTAMGYQMIEDLEPGARMITADNGIQFVRSVRREPLWFSTAECPKSRQPLFIPAEAIGNAQDITLLPHQAVMVESDMAEKVLGDRNVLMLAQDLEGVCGIHRVAPEGPATVVTLEFDNDEVIFAGSGAMCICEARESADGKEYRTLETFRDAALVAAIRGELNGGRATVAA